MDSEAVTKMEHEEDRRVSACLTFRAPSMSVISSSNVLDFPMTSRLPSVVKSLPVETIHAAIRAHNDSLLQELLTQFNRNVESLEPGQFGNTPLHVAAEVNNVKATKLLLEYRANPLAPQRSFYGRRPVHIAAALGAIDVLTYYISELESYGSKRFTTIIDNQGQTALHWATQRNQLECARLLLDNGAQIKQLQGYGTCVLHIACSQGSLSLLRLFHELCPAQLRECLANGDGSRDADGCTPIHRAALLDHSELVEFLIRTGSAVNTFDKKGRTPFDMSVSRASWRSATVLLEHGAAPFRKDPVHQRTALHHAAMAGQNLAECKAFVDLVTKNSGLRSHLNAADNKGYTALHYAIFSEDLKIVQGLLQLGADVTTRGKKDKTVLHYAAKKFGSREMTDILLKSAANPADAMACVDRYGQTVLHVAAENGQHEIVESLIARGATSIADDFGQTPLHLAAAKNNYLSLKALVDSHGSMLNHVDEKGQTPLHLAAAKDAARAVVFLLSRGALNKADNSGRTPLELAILHRNEYAGLAFVNSIHWKSLISQYSKDYGTVAQGLVEHLPQVMKACLDRCIDTHADSASGETYVTYDFSLLQSVGENGNSKSCGVRYNESPMTVLKAMSRKKRSELLSHPVCRTVLERKWIIYGLYCSLLILLSNAVFVGILSVVLIKSVDEELRPHLNQMSYDNVKKHQPEALSGRDFVRMYNSTQQPHPGYNGLPLAMVLIGALLIIFCKEVIDFASEGRRYFYDWTNYIQMFLFVFSTAFLISLYIDNHNNTVGRLTFQYGATAAFLAWLNLLRFCRPFGTFGIYSFMFFTIFQTLVQVAAFFFVLTAAFTIAFYTLFQTFIYPDDAEYYTGDPLNPDDLETIFDDLLSAGMRIGTLMLGDLEAVDRFNGPYLDGMLAYPALSFVCYGLLLIMLPVLLNNLLMGLSLGDLEAVRTHAVVLRLQMQISLHESLERLFPLRWLRRIYEQTDAYRYYPQRKLEFRTWLARWTSGESGPSVVGESLNPDEENHIAANKDRNELSQIRKRMQELDANVVEIRQLLVQALHNLDLKSAQNPSDPVEITLV